MKALVYTGPGQIEYRDEPDPVAAADEIVVKVEAVGICGSDMHDHAAGPDHSRRELPCCPAANRVNDQTKRVVADGTGYGRINDSEEIFVVGGFAPARIGISDGDIPSTPAG